MRIDPGAAYGFNALGIAYLEQAQYDKAIPAFRDAVRRAQHWSYPLHNEALAYVETGDYRSAIRAYQEAIRLTPQYSYLPYNLGLVYQRLNRRKDAEASYRKARSLAPNSAEPYNALGTLKASEGKRNGGRAALSASACRRIRTCCRRGTIWRCCWQDQTGARAGSDRSVARESGSRRIIFRRASAWPQRSPIGATMPQAIEEYRKVLAAKPDYVAARLALADLLAKTGDRDGALDQLRQVTKQDTQNPDVSSRSAIWKLRASIPRKPGQPINRRSISSPSARTQTDREQAEKRGGKLREAPAFQRALSLTAHSSSREGAASLFRRRCEPVTHRSRLRL